MSEWIREQLGRRPWWMNAMLFFCVFMALFYVPFWDLLGKSLAEDEDVWFGVRFHGVAAKISGLLHLFVYAAGMVGFWGMRPWMHPWAAAYVAQVTIAMAVWPLLYVEGASRFVTALASAAVFGWITWLLWRARPLFQGPARTLRERYGDWALVTGASAGIGVEFARALAKDGVSVVLAARREEPLRALAAELEKAHGVAARVVACDLATPEGVRQCLAGVDGLDLAILVNNAGVGYAGRFDKQTPERLAAMVQLNCAAPVALTAALLPKLRARGRGAVIFTGSVAGCQPLPLHALYAATKSFDNLLGEALWAELRGSGVDVLVLEPGVTETEFQQAAGEIAHAGESPAKVVRTALRALGHQPSVVSGLGNWLLANAAMRLLPRSVLALAAKGVMEKQTPEAMR
jgi:hypothetical protein